MTKPTDPGTGPGADPGADPNADPWATLRERLDAVHEWPCDYTFKFIMKRDLVPEFVKILGEHPYSERASSKGAYTSVTAVIWLTSSDEAIRIYASAAQFEDIVSL